MIHFIDFYLLFKCDFHVKNTKNNYPIHHNNNDDDMYIINNSNNNKSRVKSRLRFGTSRSRFGMRSFNPGFAIVRFGMDSFHPGFAKALPVGYINFYIVK